MRKLIAILTFIFFFQTSNGQDTIRRVEFGSTLLTINSFSDNRYRGIDRPPIEYINGLFFRYTRKRLGLRVNLSYNDYYYEYASPKGTADGSGGNSQNKDLRIGIGGQFSLLKHKEWFYSFLDLSYRNLFSTGHDYGGLWGANDSFSKTANGYDCFLGIGFKIKTIKHIYLSPEIGYYSSTKIINQTTVLQSGQSSNHNYSETDINPVLKLHLTVKF